MRFLGVQRPVKHRFQRLHDDRMVPVLDLSTADATFEESDNGALNGDITPSGRLTFSKSASKLREFVNFPFLTDKELGEWIVQTRFMIILRGAPGSGKSYIASCIKERYPTAEVCSSDDFWYRESGGREYRFDQSRLEEAHKNCFDRAEAAAIRGASPLVIDCSNTRAYEVRVYTDLARRFDYNSLLVTPQTPWRFDVDELTSSTQHRVPLEMVRWKVRQFEPVYPIYYGWFWAGEASCNPVTKTGLKNPRDSTEQIIADAYIDFKAILEVPNARTQLALACGFDANIDPIKLASYWHSAVLPDFGHPPARREVKPSRPHLTAMFAANGKEPGANEYAEKRSVVEALLGAVQPVNVVGLFVTKRTVGLRITLEGSQQLDLWNSDDDAAVGPDSPSVPRPKGCRAHATLALAPGVQAMVTGLDVLRIFDVEASGRSDASQVPLPRGILRELLVSPSNPTDHPDHVFYYQFSQPRLERLLFAGYY